MELNTLMEQIRYFSGPLGRGILTVLLFTHADQILQDPYALLHSLQLGSTPRPTALHCLQLLHHERSQSVDVRSRQGTAGVLEHWQQQLVTPCLNLWQKGWNHSLNLATHTSGKSNTPKWVQLEILILQLCLYTQVLTQGSLELRAFRKRSMQPFCRTVTPTSSLLADSRKSVIAVNILTSSMSGLDSSIQIHILSVNNDVTLFSCPLYRKARGICLPGCECSSTDARLLLTRPVHCVCMLSTRASGEVMMVLMPCRAADTGTGTELSAVFTAVSLSTPVIRKSTVGRMVMLPVKVKRNRQSFHTNTTFLC